MFQTFDDPADAAVADRLARLRAHMAAEGLDAVIVPRADAHQGEHVAPCDARLAWLTGFTGSAGIAAVTAERAVLFVDGRYTLAAAAQTDTALVELRNIPDDSLPEWLAEATPEGAVIGMDPWLHTPEDAVRMAVEGRDLREVPNPVDAVWPDRPAPPAGPAAVFPAEIAGATAAEKRAEIAQALQADGLEAAALTLPDSIAWLLNIRGSDLPSHPVVLGFAILHASGRVDLFTDPAKIGPEVAAHLGNEVAVQPQAAFRPALEALPGKVAVDPKTAPLAVKRALQDPVETPDPTRLAKARKRPAEIAATRAAHIRDGAAMVRFLHWLDTVQEPLTEIDVVKRLEAFRVEAGIRDIAFDTICGTGPNGAIVHYRVTEATNRPLAQGDLVLVDSGGQYPDGTTDVTRTMPVGATDPALAEPYTLVLKGLIAVSRARWPAAATGRDLDALARQALWRTKRDFAHGTGHGVGVYLGVHEGPISISRRAMLPIDPGMILSNEPGHYVEGQYGIRLENLVVCTDEGDGWRGFDSLTVVPFDRRLIAPDLLDRDELAWLDAYHAAVAETLTPALDGDAAAWLARAAAPIA